MQTKVGQYLSTRSVFSLLIIWSMIVIAWGVFLFTSATHGTRFLSHDFLLTPNRFPWLLALAFFLVAWWLMIVAMMFPSLFPFFLGRLNRAQQQEPAISPLKFITGYSCIWLLYACFIFSLDSLFHVLYSFGLLPETKYFVSDVFLLAAIFELTPMKVKATQSCSLVKTEGQQSWSLGIRYALACVFSCWHLMLCLFALGDDSLFPMALFGVIILFQKLTIHSHWFRIRYLVALGLVFYALFRMIAS